MAGSARAENQLMPEMTQPVSTHLSRRAEKEERKKEEEANLKKKKKKEIELSAPASKWLYINSFCTNAFFLSVGYKARCVKWFANFRLLKNY